jgi:IS5 family transposase
LYRKGKGKEAKLAYLGHVLLDNRHGLVANVCATAATGTAEREAAVLLLTPEDQAKTVGGDKNFDVASFVAAVRDLEITPHVAQKASGSAIDGRTTRHAGYEVSQRKRKPYERGSASKPLVIGPSCMPRFIVRSHLDGSRSCSGET